MVFLMYMLSRQGQVTVTYMVDVVRGVSFSMEDQNLVQCV